MSVGSNKLRPYFKQFESNGVFTKLVRQILLPNSSYKISLYKNEDGEYAAFWLIGFNWLNDFEADSSGEHIENPQAPKKEPDLSLNLQQIYYGAPGTGKSYKINEITKSTKNFTRTTFHPDSDYSTFVGCYKPTMEPTGTIVGGKEQTKISYSYVAQAFLQAYTAAWKNTNEPYYLIIEEINRGNCAQIFGDLFQLLDRDENGMSSYGITPDKDIANYLRKEFAKSEIENADIKNGNTMMLPSNLYILATMNTSDQSLFPIDSAFKRRWDWEYVPIEDAGKKHYIKVGNKKYDWWTFIDTINNSIDHITGSEDKKMGYWFVKPQNNDREITAKQFVGKVLFYLWNDVYKDYFDMSQCIFKIKNEDGTDEKKPFTYFFGSEVDKRIQVFMLYNKIPFISADDNVDDENDDDDEDEDGDNKSENVKSHLTIKFTNGDIVAENTYFDSYLAALKKIGLEKAEQIASEKKYQRHDCALISRSKEDGILNHEDYTYIEADGFYVVKGINGRTMRNLLNLLSAKLNLNLEVLYE